MVRKFSSYALGIYAALFIGSVIGVVTKSIIAKELGKESFGLYTYFVSLTVVSASVFSLGMSDILTKVTAEQKPYSNDFNRFGIALVFGVTLVAVIAGILLAGLIEPIYVMALFALGPAALLPVATSVFRGELSTKREVSYRLLRRVAELGFVALLVVVLAIRDEMVAVYAVVASWYLTTLYLLFLMKKRDLFISPRRFVDVARQPWLRTHIVFSVSLWLAEVVTILGSQADSLIVGNALGFVELGEYGAALLFYGLVLQVLHVLANLFVTMFPRDNNKDLPNYQRIFNMNALLIPLIGMGTLLFIPLLSPVLLDDTYRLVTPLFAVLSFALVFRSLELPNRALAITIDKPQVNMQATLASIAIYLPTLWILVNRLGLLGAALSQVIFWALYSTVQAFLLRRHLPGHAAHGVRTALVGFGVYAVAIGAFLALADPTLRVIVPPLLYAGLGHLLRLWDVRVLWQFGQTLVASVRRRLARAASTPSKPV